MPSDSLLQHILEQIEGSHYSFVRFVGRVCRHEWEWSPDDGIQSARDVVENLVREERRLVSRLAGEPGAAPASARSKDFGTPTAAAAALRGLREGTLAAFRRAGSDDDLVRKVAQSSVSLAQLDAHALGELVMLQRLVDPSRATVSPR